MFKLHSDLIGKKFCMIKQKTSVLFVNSEGKSNKVVQIPTQILLHWKKYIAILGAIFLVLISILSLMIYQTTSTHYKEKLVKANHIKSLIDLDKLKKSFRSIDESVLKINQSLQKRGLAGIAVKNAGGEENFEITDINEITDYYNTKIRSLENTLDIIPIGVPTNGIITSPFGYRENPFTGFNTELHAGIDFKGNIGDPVKATALGIVIFAGDKGGYGNCIIIKHEGDFSTLFGHLSQINVKVGQTVKIGEIIGEIGNTGRSTGPHLHYEISKNNEKINPLEYTKID
jgi:murein DD-endopeptidase MepM/ murein hydrolase activator NlpD